MRERNIRLVFLFYLAPLVYLFAANIFAMTGLVRLPFSSTTKLGQSFPVQFILLTMQLTGLLTMGYIIKRQKRKDGLQHA